MQETLALQTVTFAIAAGVFCQLLSEKVKTPSIIFLLAFGILLGPDYLGLVWPSSIQGALPMIIEIGVAIILFEGGLSLRFDQFQKMSRPIKRILTVGVLISFLGGSFASHWIIGMPWRYCFIFGALMIVTGSVHTGGWHNHLYFLCSNQGRIEAIPWDCNAYGIFADSDVPPDVVKHPVMDMITRDPRWVHRRNQVIHQRFLI